MTRAKSIGPRTRLSRSLLAANSGHSSAQAVTLDGSGARLLHAAAYSRISPSGSGGFATETLQVAYSRSHVAQLIAVCWSLPPSPHARSYGRRHLASGPEYPWGTRPHELPKRPKPPTYYYPAASTARPNGSQGHISTVKCHDAERPIFRGQRSASAGRTGGPSGTPGTNFRSSASTVASTASKTNGRTPS